MRRKRNKINKLMFLFFVVGITVSTAFCGDPNETYTIDYKLNTDLIGRLNQVTAGMTTFGCGPVALVNSMVYLQKKFPSVYGNSLVGEPTEANLKAAAAALATDTYMRTISETLTYPEYFVSGTYDYFEAKKKDKTEYDGDYVLGWDNNKGTNKSEYNFRTWLPDKSNCIFWNTLLSSIGESPSVIYIENPISGSAHYLTLSSIHLTYFVQGGKLDNSKPRKIDFIDPYDGILKEVAFREVDNKFQIFYDPVWETGHIPQWWNVQMVYNQKPVPEPATIVLLGFGGLFIKKRHDR